MSIEEENAIEHLLQGKSDVATAEAVGVSRQTVWEWRNRKPVFVAELNRRRQEVWVEAKERLTNLANKSIDVLERSLECGDTKIELATAQFLVKQLFREVPLDIGPTTPEQVIYNWSLKMQPIRY